MIQIRPVSDLRNKYPEVERLVTQQQQPVFLTKNGYGSIQLIWIICIQITIHCFKQNLSFKAKQAHASRLRLLCSC